MFIPDPGVYSKFMIFIHPGSGIPDPTTETKTKSLKNFRLGSEIRDPEKNLSRIQGSKGTGS
jgi:hypothetical protein